MPRHLERLALIAAALHVAAVGSCGGDVVVDEGVAAGAGGSSTSPSASTASVGPMSSSASTGSFAAASRTIAFCDGVREDLHRLGLVAKTLEPRQHVLPEGRQLRAAALAQKERASSSSSSFLSDAVSAGCETATRSDARVELRISHTARKQRT